MMRQILLFSIVTFVFLSCKKDKVPKEEPCNNVELTGKRAAVVGTWRWYKTLVDQTFVSGTYTSELTPSTEGFDYYCTISEDGRYRGYRDSNLVEDFVLTSLIIDHDNGVGNYYLTSFINCTDNKVRMTVFFGETSIDDKLDVREFPIYINDSTQKKYSSFNFFKRVQ